MQFVDEGTLGRRLAALPGPEPRIVVAGNIATPWEILWVVDRSLPRCRLFVLNPQEGWPRRPGIVTETPFLGPGVRDDPAAEYLPMRLSLVPRLFAALRPPDAVLLHVAPPRNGTLSLGTEVNILPAAVERVRRRGGLVVAQVNPQVPATGGDALVAVNDVDLAVEVDTPLPSPPVRAADDVSRAIGERVAAYARDGATLQLGIGLVPDAAAAALAERRCLGVWTELLGDGILGLEQAGALDPDRPMVATFLFGSPALYAWADGNPRLEMRRTETVNDPARIARHPAVLSINSALQVDLFDQANAAYMGGRPYSGFGGQPDFVTGALHSPGGHAVIALRSWHEGTGCSTIVPFLRDPASSFQHSVIATEHGCAEVFGEDRYGQARLLVDRAAHPLARDELRDAAGSLGLSPGSSGGAGW